MVCYAHSLGGALMLRRTLLKSTTGLKRSTGLKPGKPLAQGKPLARNTPLKAKPPEPGAPVKQRKPLAPRSKKRAAQERDYAAMRAAFLVGPCACCVDRWKAGEIDKGAIRRATEVHHRAGREGALLLLKALWLPVCRRCHEEIESQPAEAVRRGWVISRHLSLEEKLAQAKEKK